MITDLKDISGSPMGFLDRDNIVFSNVEGPNLCPARKFLGHPANRMSPSLYPQRASACLATTWFYGDTPWPPYLYIVSSMLYFSTHLVQANKALRAWSNWWVIIHLQNTKRWLNRTVVLSPPDIHCSAHTQCPRDSWERLNHNES